MTAAADHLKSYWDELAAHQGWNQEDAETIYTKLMGRYDEPHRHFHIKQHLLNIINVADLDQFEPDDRAAFLAMTFWHDGDFEIDFPRSQGNEERSALLAENDLTFLGSSPDFVARVARGIRNSKNHICDAEIDAVEAHFLDCDIATVGSSWENFSEGSRLIDMEFAPLNKAKLEGRLKFFINDMLDRDVIYLLPANRAKYEEQARKNLAAYKVETENDIARFEEAPVDDLTQKVKVQPV